MRHTSQVLKIAAAAALATMFSLSATAQTRQRNPQAQPAQGQAQPQDQAQAQGQQAPAQGQTQVQGQAAQVPQGPPMICGNNALCQETQDFAATITSFRVSTNYYKQRILDMTVRFQNKTNQPLILGYVNQSGTATDDRGNRSVPWGPNAYLGIGLVAGPNFDPRFALNPGGWGDAQFEYVQQGVPQLIGFNFTLDFAVSEINSYEGNQHTLGGQFPLHFDGLRNGVASAAPMYSPGSVSGASNSIAGAVSNPCGTAGALTQSNGTAANAVSNATNAINAVTSLWHKKKQNATPASQAVPCDPNASNGAVVNAAPPAMPNAQPAPATAQSATQSAGTVKTTTPAIQPKVVQAAARTNVTQGTATAQHPATVATTTPPRTATTTAAKPATTKPSPQHAPAPKQQPQPVQGH